MKEKNLLFESQEDNHNKTFKNIKMPLSSPAIVLSVTLLEFRKVTNQGLLNILDTPDVLFEISCPEIKQVHKTRFIIRNLTSGEVNEKFKFVFSRNHDLKEEIVVFKLFDRDTFTANDFIGETTIDVSELSLNDEPQRQTIQFQNDSKICGTLEVEMHKEMRTTPDFRLSLALCPEEIDFRKKRIPIVCNAMKEILGKKYAPRDETETPIVSLVGSGGGYRAVIGMSGAMEALNDAGLLDIFTYNCGLSGSAWYLSAAYALQGISSGKLKHFHDEVRERLDNHLMWELVEGSTYAHYIKTVANFLKVHDLPKSIVNFFPGFLVGQHLFGEEKLDVKLTDLAAYVKTGEVPYPLMVALNVKDKVSANKFHAYVERSPHEIYLPSYGIGLKPEDEGTVWNNGIKLRSSTEYPLHFTVGMAGCAFSILLNQYYENGTESGATVSNLKSYDKIRVKDRKQTNKKRNRNESNRESFDLPIESDVDSDDSEYDSDFGNESSDDELKHAFAETPVKRKSQKIRKFSKSTTPSTHAAGTFPISATDATDDELPFVAKLIKNIFSEVYKDRSAVIGRTAKVPNFVYKYNNQKRFYLNPFGRDQNLDAEKQMLVDHLGHKCVGDDVHMSTTTKNLSFADAGIFKNVPTDAVLRPQRGTDIMIVMDFNGYKLDKKFSYRPLLAAAAHSWQSGLKFPKFDVEKIRKGEPKELHIFPSDEDDCPTVLWFTLCNKKFKNLENYKPRSPENETNEKFNDFSVFGSESKFSTFRFQYDKYHFDQLRELMYYNVSSHIEEIKEALIEATERKRKRSEWSQFYSQNEMFLPKSRL